MRPGKPASAGACVSPIALDMLAAEAAAGRRPLYPGNSPAWVRPEDWRGWPVLAVDKLARELHIIAVWAARPRAFSDLIEAALTDGLAPVVVAPFPAMRAIVDRWGWCCTVTGAGWERREEWRPGPRGWRGGRK